MAPIQTDCLAIKISKIGATRCHVLRLKCTKFDFRWGFVLDPSGGAYSAPLNPLAVFKGPTSTGTEGEGGGEGKRERKEREGCPPIGGSRSASTQQYAQDNLRAISTGKQSSCREMQQQRLNQYFHKPQHWNVYAP